MKYERYVELNYYHKLVLNGKMNAFLHNKIWEWIEEYRRQQGSIK